MRSLNPIPRNIIFDFGGVLAHIDISRALDEFTKLGIGPIDVRDIHPYNRGIFLDFELGNISPDEFLDGLRNISGKFVSATDQQLKDAWNAIVLPFDYERFRPLLKLRENGHKVFLLSNTNLIHHEDFEGRFDRENPFGLKLRDFFDRVYYSDELHLRKPGREIYELVLSENGLKPEETIFIDDNQINLDAPAKIGMQVLEFPKDCTIGKLFGM